MTPSKAQAATGPGAPPVTSYAWYVVGVLTACYTLSYIDRQILGTFVGPIRQEFGITDAQFGMLQGLAFAIFYTFVGLPLGRVVDRANRRNIIIAGVIIWSFFTTSCALADSFTQLFISRIGVGIGEATLGPAAFSIMADYFPRERLGTASNIFYIGNMAGASLALLIGGAVRQAVAGTVAVPILGEISGWRVVFLLLGIPGMIFALIVFTVKEPARKSLMRGADGLAANLSVAQVWREIGLRWQSVAGISLAFACQAACNYGFSAWAVEYFLRVHKWQPGQTTRALGFLMITCAVAGLYVGGWMCDRWTRRGILDAPLRVTIPSAIGVVLFLATAMLAPTPEISLALAAPGLFMIALPMGVAGASFQHIFPNQVRGQVTALYLFILNIGGLPLGNYLPGFLTTQVFKDDLKLGVAVAITIGICGTLMLLFALATRGPYRRHYEMMHPGAAGGSA
jgi:MFS family permease